MKFMLAALVFALLSPAAFAKDKPHGDYHEGILVNFQTVRTGSSCSSSGTVKGDADDSGNVTGRTEADTNCVDRTIRHYTIKVEDHTYVIKPTLAWWASPTFSKNSVLANLLPGSHVLVRTDESGFYVKIGKRESKYAIVGAE